MSFEFTVPAAGPPSVALAALLRTAGGDLAVLDGEGEWPPGVRQVYRPGVSTRCVEVSADDSGVGVRVLVCSSPEDYALAVALAQAAAWLVDAGEVVPEDGEPVRRAELPERYGRPWAMAEIRSGATVLARVVEEHAGKTVSLSGPNRSFEIGPRLLDELRAAGAADGFADRLVAAMRRTQWPGDCFIASVLEVRDRAGTGATRVAVLSPNSRTLLPAVDLVALHDPAGAETLVPADAVIDLLGQHAAYLDERRLLVQAVPVDEWQALLQRAAVVATGLS